MGGFENTINMIEEDNGFEIFMKCGFENTIKWYWCYTCLPWSALLLICLAC